MVNLSYRSSGTIQNGFDLLKRKLRINMSFDNNTFRITDGVQEFAVQTSVPTAEFGRGHGAQPV